MLDIKSPGRGLQPNRINDLLGSRAKRDIESGDVFHPSDLNSQITKPRKYNFSRKSVPLLGNGSPPVLKTGFERYEGSIPSSGVAK